MKDIKDVKVTLEDVLKEIKEKKGKANVLENTYLKRQEEYKKELYIKMLCVATQYSKNMNENQHLYINRIINGIDCTKPYEFYSKLASENTKEIINEFIDIFKDDKMKYCFLIDIMILYVLNKDISEKEYEALANFVELIGVNKIEIESLINVVCAIIEQDSDKYSTAYNNLPYNIKTVDLMFYVKDFFEGVMYDENNYYKCFYKQPTEIVASLVYDDVFTQKRVHFEKAIISIDKCWEFLGCDEVVFDNCEIVTYVENTNIIFSGVKKVKFNNCKIIGFKYNRFAVLENFDIFEFTNNIVSNCGFSKVNDYGKAGAVFKIAGNRAKEMTIKDNNFDYIYSRASYFVKPYNNGLIMGIKGDAHSYKPIIIEKIEIINNTFNNCDYYYNDMVYDYRTNCDIRKLFAGIKYANEQDAIIKNNKYSELELI